MADPWLNDPVIGTSSGGPVYGPAPKIDPYKARDQELQEQAAARAEEDQRFQREKFEREMAAGVGKDGKATESERTAAFLATRVGGGMKDIQSAIKGAPGANKPEIDAAIAGNLPWIGGVARNWLNSPERQRVEAAQLDVLDAALTLGTGAAYSKEQLAGYQQAYFPQIGDDETTVADKQARLRRLFESAKLKAGGSAHLIDEALAALGAAPEAGTGDSLNTHSNRDKMPRPPGPGERAVYDEGSDSWTYVSDQDNPNALEVDVVGGRLPPEVQAEIDQRVSQTDQFGSGLAGATDTITFGMADEAAAGLNAFTGALGGQGSLVDLYNRNIGVERGVQDALQKRDGGEYFTGQLLGGLALPIGAGAQGAGALARIGAIQGGLYGYGSSEGNPLQRIPGAAAGAAIGGAAGGTLGGLSGLVRNRGTGAAAQEVMDNRAVIEAGQRQGIPIRQPDARPSTRADFAGAEASETGNRIITPALRSDAQAVENKLVETGGQGRALDDYEMGQRVQAAGDKYLVRTRGQANALYGRAEQLAGNAQGQATRAIQAIGQEIADLSSTGANTNAGAIKYLEALKADLQGGASIAKLRNIRSNVRGQINERNLTSTDTERRVGNVLKALSDDVNSILPPNARGAFANADKFYRERMEFKDQVIRRFVGAKNDPISPETAAARFQSFMKSKDFGRFSRMMDELEPGDRADIAATVAEHLGRGRNGEFSLAALSTNVSNMSPKALEKVFGAKGAQAIQDLKVIARAKADTANALNNSRSGVVAQRMGLKDAMFGIFGGSVAGIPGAIGGFAFRSIGEKVGNRRLANALLNPDFSKWLKNMPNNPAAAKPYIGLLTNVAAKSGAGADIKAIQSALLEAFAQSPARAAAEQEDNGGNVPPQ